MTVNYTISGTAVCGTDYTISGADCATNTGSFAIPASTKPFTNITPLVITLTDDDTADSGETVILTLTEGSGYFLDSFISSPAFTLSLYDDTGAAAFSLGGTPAVGRDLDGHHHQGRSGRERRLLLPLAIPRHSLRPLERCPGQGQGLR